MKTSKSRASASECAVRLLSFRPRARGELTAAMLGRGYSPAETEQALDELTRLGYLNDVAFLESWCYYRLHVAPKGRRFVRLELAEKGVSRADLEQHFDRFYSPQAERSCLQQLMEKQLRRPLLLREGREPAARQKIVNKFMQKGFAPSLIFAVLDSLAESVEADPEA